MDFCCCGPEYLTYIPLSLGPATDTRQRPVLPQGAQRDPGMPKTKVGRLQQAQSGCISLGGVLAVTGA